jgi:hypothetical protein
MLISITKQGSESPEEVEMNVALISDGAMGDFESPWFGQPFRLRGVFRDGTQFALGLSLTECAELFLLFDRDATVRSWAEMMETRLAERNGTGEL